MGLHVCLAKRLQRDLTSLGVLWLPPTQPSLARFINSVVHGEESDVDLEGRAVSHFDLYLSAMDEVSASTAEARGFVATPQKLFQRRLAVSPVEDQYDVTADGRRFLVIDPEGQPTTRLTVLTNWPAALKPR